MAAQLHAGVSFVTHLLLMRSSLLVHSHVRRLSVCRGSLKNSCLIQCNNPVVHCHASRLSTCRESLTDERLFWQEAAGSPQEEKEIRDAVEAAGPGMIKVQFKGKEITARVVGDESGDPIYIGFDKG